MIMELRKLLLFANNDRTYSESGWNGQTVYSGIHIEKVRALGYEWLRKGQNQTEPFLGLVKYINVLNYAFLLPILIPGLLIYA